MGLPQFFRHQMMDLGIRQVSGRGAVSQLTNVQVPALIHLRDTCAGVEVISCVITKDGRHRLGIGSTHQRRSVAMHEIHRILHSQFGIRLEDLGLVSQMLADEARPDVLVVNLLEST